MDVLLTNTSSKTVSSIYSWDSSVPNKSVLVDCITSTNPIDDIIEIVGYSPSVHLKINSEVLSAHSEAIAFERVIDFGDYYNSEDSIQTTSSNVSTELCHNYIMPGEYKISFSQTEYFVIPNLYEDDPLYPRTYKEDGPVYGKRQPFSWMWYNFYCEENSDPRNELFASFEPRRETMTWEDCSFQGKKSVTWEEIAGESIETRKKAVAWRWETTKKDSTNILNQKVEWRHLYKKSFLSRTWKSTRSKDCIGWSWLNKTLSTQCDKWSTLTPNQIPIKWKDKNSKQCIERTPQLSSTTIEKQKIFSVKVIEIPPTCYLEAYEFAYFLTDEINKNDPEKISISNGERDTFYFNSSEQHGEEVEMRIVQGQNLKMKVRFLSSRLGLDFSYREAKTNSTYYGRFVSGTIDITDLNLSRINKASPYTVRLSPRKIRAGSFPIEKLIWDFGDGSPLVVQHRKHLNTELPFIYNDEFVLDVYDPRNYDVHHTYYRTSHSGNCFTPSITAIASSTSTMDCASVVIGPLDLPAYIPSNTKLVQNQLLYNQKTQNIQSAYLGLVGGDAAVWKKAK